MIRVLTWNVAGRVRDSQDRQIAALAGQPADIVCLQEVTPTNHERWRATLEDRGMHVEISEWPAVARGSRRLAALVASREPLTQLPGPPLPWPERHLTCAVREPGGGDPDVRADPHWSHPPEPRRAPRPRGAGSDRRAPHGYERRDRSWVPFHRGPGYRLDHIILSPGLRPLACDYVHAWREQRWIRPLGALCGYRDRTGKPRPARP